MEPTILHACRETPGTSDLLPECEDKFATQWNRDFSEHKPKPTTAVPGVEFMLARAIAIQCPALFRVCGSRFSIDEWEFMRTKALRLRVAGTVPWHFDCFRISAGADIKERR
jgi:hypothetical protein